METVEQAGRTRPVELAMILGRKTCFGASKSSYHYFRRPKNSFQPQFAKITPLNKKGRSGGRLLEVDLIDQLVELVHER